MKNKCINTIFKWIEEEKYRQLCGIELIASENFVSTNVLKSVGSILTNKYAEGYPYKRYYGGCDIVDKIELQAINCAKKLFGATYANVQPHSGSQANAAIYMSILQPGDTILGFDLAHGGHLTHGNFMSFSGSIYRGVFYGVDKKTSLINYDQMMGLAKQKKPKLIICGASAYSRDINYKIFREAADSVGSLLMADISHTAGIIAKGFLNNPFPHCHIITSTTHKTLRGPRGGLILLKEDFEWGRNKKTAKKLSHLIEGAVFPGVQGGPMEHVIAGKAIAFSEALSNVYKNYIIQVIKNSKKLAKELMNKGYKILSGGTDNHCILIDLRNKKISGKEAENILVKADITCNKNIIPYDDKSAYITSGIRLGTAAITTRGLKENEMEMIANLIDKVLLNKGNDIKLKKIKNEINFLMKKYPLFKG